VSAGFNVRMETYDWATYASVRRQPELFDLASSTFSFKPDPAMIVLFDSGYVPRWDSEKKNAIQSRMAEASTFEDRYAAWEDLQALVYEEVPFITVGFGFPMFVASTAVQNIGTEMHPFTMPLSFWGAWFSETP